MRWPIAETHVARQRLEIFIGQESAIVVVLEPVINVGLIEIRGDGFLSEFVRVGAQKRHIEPG
jgi:hypothetical protein